MDDDARDEVDVLRDRVASLEAMVASLVLRLGDASAHESAPPERSVPAGPAAPGSRRDLLKLAGAAAVAGGLAAGTGDRRASAATDDPMQVGVRHFATNITRIEYGSAPNAAALPLTSEARMLWVDNSNSPTQEGIGVRGDGSPSFGIGLDGYGSTGVRGTGSTVPGVGIGVSGSGYYGLSAFGTVGLTAIGQDAALQLATTNTTPPPSRSGVVGYIATDGAGGLWYCVATGSPGRWRKLSGPDAAGSFHAIDPVRSFDSRWPANSRLTSGTSVLVSVADGHDSGGAVTAMNAVPPGATAVVGNLTITQTVGSGFLSVTPGSPVAPSTPPTTSSINWAGDALNLANGLIVKLDTSRQIRVRCGGGGSTDFVIDVTGYFL